LYKNASALGIDNLKGYAVGLKLDPEKFNTCLDSSSQATTVEKSLALADKLGIRGSPTFFINGRQISGAQPFERFKEIIDLEIKSASKPAK
jgi:protein-disulfide isomerase